MLKKKEVLDLIAKTASAKSKVEITPTITEAVLESTSSVIKSELAKKDVNGIFIPHIGTFKPRFVPGGMKEVRNVATGEKFTKEVADRHKIIIKLQKSLQTEFNEMKK